MKRKCKVCKKKFNLKKENKYQIYVAPVGLNCIVEGGKTFEAFDCPMCGCQNIVNIREVGTLVNGIAKGGED